MEAEDMCMLEEAGEYEVENHVDARKREGWEYCEECGEWLHLEDVASGMGCRGVDEVGG